MFSVSGSVARETLAPSSTDGYAASVGSASCLGRRPRLNRRGCDHGRYRNAASRGVHGYLTRDGVLPEDFLRIGTEALLATGVEDRLPEIDGIDDLYGAASRSSTTASPRSKGAAAASSASTSVPATLAPATRSSSRPATARADLAKGLTCRIDRKRPWRSTRSWCGGSGTLQAWRACETRGATDVRTARRV